jgi:predicted RNase H-like HicB family nuclease
VAQLLKENRPGKKPRARRLALSSGNRMMIMIQFYAHPTCLTSLQALQSGYWVAECPSLPGCVSQGATREESIRNIQEAIEGCIAVLREDGLPVPEDKLEALLLAV